LFVKTELLARLVGVVARFDVRLLPSHRRRGPGSTARRQLPAAIAVRADRALYAAKEQGRDRVCVADS
jgi:GGDEF domain-containing protein